MKKGSSIVIYPVILILSIILILVIFNLIIQIISPFITYQKINNIANKYMFIVEKFGYLNNKEKQDMNDELLDIGLIQDNLEIIYPDTIKNYGEELKLVIKYKIDLNIRNYLFDNNINKKETILIIEKNSFSKI